MPGIILSVLHVLTYLILMANIQERYHLLSYLINEETESHRGKLVQGVQS